MKLDAHIENMYSMSSDLKMSTMKSDAWRPVSPDLHDRLGGRCRGGLRFRDRRLLREQRGGGARGRAGQEAAAIDAGLFGFVHVAGIRPPARTECQFEVMPNRAVPPTREGSPVA